MFLSRLPKSGLYLIAAFFAHQADALTSSAGNCFPSSPSSSSSSSRPASTYPINCKVDVTNQWSGGYQVNVKVGNTGTVTSDKWTVVLNIPTGESLASVWNATKVAEWINANSITYVNTDWNGTIAPNSSVSFGATINHSGTTHGTPGCQVIPPYTNIAPITDFSADVNGATVQVQSVGVSDPDGDKLTYEIDFGDGTVIYSSEAWHTYKTPGVYTITHKVSDYGSYTAKTREVTVSAASGNRAPVAIFSYTLAGSALNTNASAATDIESDPLIYSWNLGNGSNLGNSVTATGIVPAGGTSVTLTVFDGELGDTRQVMVYQRTCGNTNGVPKADFTSTVNGSTVKVDASDSALADQLTWDMGDGTVASGMYVTHTYAAAGSYTITLSAKAGTATAIKSALVSVQVEEENLPPVAVLKCQGYIKHLDDFVNYNPTISFETSCDATGSSDPEGKALGYSFDWGDGRGVVTSDTGKFYKSFSPIGLTYRFTLSVSDGANTSIETLDFKTSPPVVVNLPPVIEFACEESILVADDFANGIAIETPVARCSTAGSADPEGGPLEFSIDWGDGSASQLTSGEFFYHNYALGGDYIITVSAREYGRGNTTVKTFAWTASTPKNNRPPIAEFACTEEVFTSNYLDGSPVTFYQTSCSAEGSRDPDNNPLTYVVSWGDGTSSTPYHKQEFAHMYEAGGTYEVSLTVSDGVNNVTGKLAQQVSSTINPNAAPTACFEITGAGPIQLSGACTVDRDGDALNYQWNFGDGTAGTGQLANHTYQSPGLYEIILLVSDGKQNSYVTNYFTQAEQIEEKDTRCEFHVANEWSSGFTGWVRVYNQSDAPVSGWGMDINFAGSNRLTSFWNAKVTGANPYAVQSHSWNSTIKPGAYVEFGFQGAKNGGTLETPVLSGISCQ